MSVIISVRVDEKIKKEIEKLGYNPGDFVKDIIIKELKRERSKKALLWLRKHRLEKKSKSVVDQIRENRDFK